MKVGFIGLGHMGAPMSRNILAAGHDLVVHDLRPEAAIGLLADGAAWADSPREAGAGREAVITMLPGPPAVEQVLLGAGGLLGGRLGVDRHVHQHAGRGGPGPGAGRAARHRGARRPGQRHGRRSA
jgi:3-hydroxyisobutyrate dehydrogenase-like beta-hydroxyacid dehydrogenase